MAMTLQQLRISFNWSRFQSLHCWVFVFLPFKRWRWSSSSSSSCAWWRNNVCRFPLRRLLQLQSAFHRHPHFSDLHLQLQSKYFLASTPSVPLPLRFLWLLQTQQRYCHLMMMILIRTIFLRFSRTETLFFFSPNPIITLKMSFHYFPRLSSVTFSITVRLPLFLWSSA